MSDSVSGDFLAWLGVSLTGQRILQLAAREYELHRTWITLDALAYEFVEMDVGSEQLNEVFRLPRELGGMWNGEQLNLTGLGLVEAGTAPRTAKAMADLARICGMRKLELRGAATIGKEVLMREHGYDEDAAISALDLVQRIPGLTSGGNLGPDWSLEIWRGALDYRNVESVDDLRMKLEHDAILRVQGHQAALAQSPAFSFGGVFHSEESPDLVSGDVGVPSGDASAVFVIHGRDQEARDAIWAYLRDLGLSPLDWEDLVIETGSGAPYIGQVLDAAFRLAKAVLVVMTPDDCVKLHDDLVEVGEEDYESELSGQPRPNVLFEAGMAFGFNPSRTIIIEIGVMRPVSDLRGRHTIRIGTQDTLRALAGRLRAAGCSVSPVTDSWLNVERFSTLAARLRRA